MTTEERRELARVAKAIDMEVRRLPPAVMPLGWAAVECLLEVDPHEAHGCTVCGAVPGRHRCSCPFSPGQLPKWVRQQRRRAA